MSKKHFLHKKHNVWVRQEEGGAGPQYFNIIAWKYQDFKGSMEQAELYDIKDILARMTHK